MGFSPSPNSKFLRKYMKKRGKSCRNNFLAQISIRQNPDGDVKKDPSISGNILLYKSEPKVRRVAIEAAAAAKEKGDPPQETNRASAAADADADDAAARVPPSVTQKGG